MTDAAVAVIGGGISGLAAAYELHQQQVPFVLLEKSARVGGLVRTEQVDGFTIDAGPQVKALCAPGQGAAVATELARVPGVIETRRTGLGPDAHCR